MSATRRAAPGDAIGGTRLLVDPVACQGIGMCAHLAPRIIDLDPWGYPVVPTAELDRPDRRAAERAVRGCPRRALQLTVE